MSDTETANAHVVETIRNLTDLLARKTQFGKWNDDVVEIINSIATLRASMNPTIINNIYGPQS